MESLAMIFTALMIAAALAATILIGLFAVGLWGALAFAGLLILLYRAVTHRSAPLGPMRRDQLNAFQRPLSDG
ncbi:hypothetical protein DL1_03360 [Thioclava dalianensis]|uniref:Uncharacterized protein n=2 Tax=Thioclava dalianensis TaxID=1185766 RepID=A0A074THN2_9RHOB|nr:hypothetical protein DL1_03360 [Thioclava dalianensis]